MPIQYLPLTKVRVLFSLGVSSRWFKAMPAIEGEREREQMHAPCDTCFQFLRETGQLWNRALV